MKSYKELKVWQKARELCLTVYALGSQLPRSEKYRLEDQMCRAGISIISNIAEGFSRRSTREYIRFLHIAYASSAELEAQLLLSKDLYSNLSIENALNSIIEIQKMLFTIILRLNQKLQLSSTNS